MNPWGLVIAGLGVVVIILGVKGSYANIETLLTGKPHTQATSSSSGGINLLGGQPSMTPGPVQRTPGRHLAPVL